MSLEQAKAFIEKMKSDEAFTKRIMAIEDSDARFQAIAEAGFDFTKEELEQVRQKLDEADLEQVSGGGEGCGGKMVCMMFLCNITTAHRG
ncbi:MAG: Nif11-like leader peptide family natural product precursor [Desulfobacteraceae bacterium]|nr:Nif11-like leader peptide family natural product precursor [Desulfobacteraceae bacterium]